MIQLLCPFFHVKSRYIIFTIMTQILINQRPRYTLDSIKNQLKIDLHAYKITEREKINSISW